MLALEVEFDAKVVLMKEKITTGLLGLGKVGRNLLLQYSIRNHRFKISWIADSRRFLTKRNQEPFSKKDVRKILGLRDRALKAGHCPEYEGHVSGCRVYDFDDLTNEISILRELTSDTLRHSVILDTTSSNAHTDAEIAQNIMGCLAFCTGNKAPWADYGISLHLYREAKRSTTFLGLNCTLGVWVDQMEILPIVVQALKSGGVQFLKRDNSSFNLFFAKVASGIAADRAIVEIGAKGHLEKTGPDALSAEVKDQMLKASIAANICGILRGQSPSATQTSLEAILRQGPSSVKPTDIARWHREGRKLGEYRALISEIIIDAESLEWRVGFDKLPYGHPLARDFIEKCAISVQVIQDSKFNWSSDDLHSKCAHRSFVYSGYGGAVRTAAKLLWEVERAISLSQLRLDQECFPLPVLCSLALGRSDAVNLQRKLARNLA